MTGVALKGLAARPLRTILTALAIVLGVALVSASFTLTDTQRSAAEALSSAAYDGTDAVVTARSSVELEAYNAKPTVPAELLDEVRSQPGVTAAAGDITGDAFIIGTDGEPVGSGPYFGVGLDPEAPAELTPFRLQEGDWATGPGQVVVDAKTAEEEDYAIGETIRVAARGGAQEYEVTGIATFGPVKALGPATAAIFDLETARQVFARDGYDSILVSGEVSGLGSQYTVESASAHDRYDLGGLDQFISIIRTVLLVFGLVAVLVGAFTILNTLSITVAQRTREFGLLRMIGASKRQVLRTVLLEALVLGVLASAVGTALGVLLAKALSGAFAALGLDLPEAGTVFAARTAVVAMLVGTLATLVAGFVPARRATRVQPVAALRESASGDGAGGAPGRVGRLVRALVSVIGRPAERLGGTAGRLARRNAMRAPGRTGATAAALVIGVALTTAVTVVATGLKDGARNSIGDRVSAPYVVVGADGWSPVDPKVEQRLAEAPGVELATSLRQDVGLAFDDEEYVNAVDPAAIGEVFDFEWAEGSTATLAQLGADGAVVDEGWATEHGLTVGERFELTSPKGEELTLTIRGIERSPVIDVFGLGPITIGQAAYEQAGFVEERSRMTFVQAASLRDVEPVMEAFPEAAAHTTGAYIDEQVGAVDTLLAVFGVLLALCVLVSLFGIVNALVLATFERTRELGTLRALGMSRRQMRRMVRHESIITALLGAAIGMVVGLGLAAIVTSVFSEEGLTFAVPVVQLVIYAAVACLAGVLAAVFPARRAARLDPLTALAYE